MDIFKFIKTFLLIALVGSSLTFSSTLLRNSVEVTENKGVERENGNWREIVFLIFLLEVLGVAIFILFFALSKLADYRPQDLFLLAAPNGRWSIS